MGLINGNNFDSKQVESRDNLTLHTNNTNNNLANQRSDDHLFNESDELHSSLEELDSILQIKFALYEEEIESLSKKNQKLFLNTSNVNGQINALNERVKELEAENASLKNEKNEIKSRIRNVILKVDSLSPEAKENAA